MQPIHIETLSAKPAAAQIANILRNSSAPWLVWSANDEGYMMAPASSREASAVRRYYPSIIAGSFLRDSPRAIAAQLKRARASAAVHGPANTPERKAWQAAYKRQRRAMVAA
ncbi:hypothetical protein [Rhodanobacter lindaniclasticus]|uniref:Uncharacterized protein n=1 Tax=Rhodanobacter lindaniclasticus TaxID=75310 RepID=A0A4S3KDZ4_9GAMM|nr:hypothetical protein [Rhodanobacter lindaniclasticus]THD06134.1 hypothetical protein B1991_14420 [Rhodanobacter lindaniclasticus]